MNRPRFLRSTHRLSLFVFFHCALLNGLNAQLQFHEHAPLPEPGRDDAVCFVISDELYVTGGGGDGFFLQGDMWRYNLAHDSWQALSDFPSVTRQYAYAETIGKKAYHVGGITKAQVSLDELWEYDPEVDQWTQLSPFPGAGRYKAVGFVLDEALYYGSGTDGDLVFSDFYRYDPSLDLWTALPDIPGPARYERFSYAYGDQAYVGGGIDSAGLYSDELFIWDAVLQDWRSTLSLPHALAYAEGACADGFCAVWDGLIEGLFSGELLFPQQQITAPSGIIGFDVLHAPGVPIRNSSVCASKERIYRFGGKDSSGFKYSALTSVTLELEGELRVFPNPCTADLRISSKTSWSSLRIYDVTGLLVFEGGSSDVFFQQTLSFESLVNGPGLYYLLVDNLPPVRIVFSP